MTTKLDRILAFDPLYEAEKVTGKSYKGSDDTTALGFLFAQENGRQRRAALIERGDTTLTNKLPRYIEIIESIGFEPLLREEFCDTSFGRQQTNAFYVYARRDGIVLKFDSYHGDTSVNSGNFFYNWRPSQRYRDTAWNERPAITSSGGLRDDIWVGDHDCREALVHRIALLQEWGDFLPQWEQCAFPWLCSYWDHKAKGPLSSDFTYLYDATERRVALLPEWVRTMVGPLRDRL